MSGFGAMVMIWWLGCGGWILDVAVVGGDVEVVGYYYWLVGIVGGGDVGL